MNKQTHTIGEVGAIEGVSTTRAHKIVKEPGSRWERVGRNQYLLHDQGAGGQIDFSEWRAFEKKEAALIRAIERQKLEGEVVPVEAVKRVMTQLILTARNRIMALPKMLAPQLALETELPICESILDDHLRECLSELTHLDPAQFSQADHGAADKVSATAKKNNKRVGGRTPKTPRRK